MARVARADVQWYLPGAKRPFAGSTMATSDLLRACGGEGWTWGEASERLAHLDSDGALIVATFLAAGYGPTPISTHVL